MRIKTSWIAAAYALLMSCLVLPARGQAPVFSNADFSGTYLYSFEVNEPAPRNRTSYCEVVLREGDQWSCFGLLTADGSGNLSGTRTVVRKARHPLDHVPASGECPSEVVEVVQQTITGTYHLTAQGAGTARLIVNPRPDWDADHFNRDTEDEQQTLHFSVTPGGQELRGVLEITGEEVMWKLREYRVPYRMIVAGSATRASSPTLPVRSPELPRFMR